MGGLSPIGGLPSIGDLPSIGGLSPIGGLPSMNRSSDPEEPPLTKLSVRMDS
ncbi:MAG: hypothetical protein ACI3YK_00875 [Eubacteriales bacterium]